MSVVLVTKDCRTDWITLLLMKPQSSNLNEQHKSHFHTEASVTQQADSPSARLFVSTPSVRARPNCVWDSQQQLVQQDPPTISHVAWFNINGTFRETSGGDRREETAARCSVGPGCHCVLAARHSLRAFFCRGSKASALQRGDYITITKVAVPLFSAIFRQPERAAPVAQPVTALISCRPSSCLERLPLGSAIELRATQRSSGSLCSFCKLINLEHNISGKKSANRFLKSMSLKKQNKTTPSMNKLVRQRATSQSACPHCKHCHPAVEGLHLKC